MGILDKIIEHVNGAETASAAKLSVDGKGGKNTVKRLQKFLGVKQDGVITGQNKEHKKYHPALTAVKYGKGSSTTVKKMQKWLGIKADGKWGKNTSIALQKKLGVKADGVAGSATFKALQKFLNNSTPKPTPAPTPTPTPTPQPTPTPVVGNGAKIAAKATEYCWPYGTASSKYSYKKGTAKKAYKTALKKYLGLSKKLQRSDCGHFITTCVRASGVSKSFKALKGRKQSFPSVPSTMYIVHKGKKIPSGLLQAGDIVRYKKTNGGQHVLMYYGDGKIAEAGRGSQFPAIEKDTKKYNKSNVRKKTLQVIRAK